MSGQVRPWSGNAVMRARAVVQGWLPAPCGCGCGRVVDGTEPWVVGHARPRGAYPELTWVQSNWRPELRTCSDASGQRGVVEKAKREALASVGADLPRGAGGAEPRLLPAHTLGATGRPMELRGELTWASLGTSSPDWLTPFLDVPVDASPPLAVSPVHDDAVGSYGAAAVEWMEANLLADNGRPLRLRWWQRLALALQLQHRDDGSLCFRTVIESAPRRSGKSVRLRSVALWRLAVGADLFHEPQLVLHSGKDLQIVREVMKKSWRWALAREGWDVRRGAGQEEVSSGDGENRWLVRAQDACYGYDVGMALADESWGIPAHVIEEAIEPAMLERESPQLVMTTTAHRRSTTLMRRRISAALAADDNETLLLLWGARPQDDPADPATWRAASPHWSEDRRRVIAGKWAAALSGEGADLEADEPDPMQAFLAQYLNVWRLDAAPVTRGDELVTEDDWNALATARPPGPPDAAAVESWFSRGVSVALAWGLGSEAVVSVSDHPDLASARTALTASGFAGRATVGESLLDDPALKGLRAVKGRGAPVAAARELSRLVAEGGLSHDGGEHLTGQVLGARTREAPAGPALVSKGRADALKAAAWAAASARGGGVGKPRVLMPSA